MVLKEGTLNIIIVFKFFEVLCNKKYMKWIKLGEISGPRSETLLKYKYKRGRKLIIQSLGVF